MIEIKRDYDCTGCGACEGVCPTQCITMQSNDEGFLYPHVDSSRCVGCSMCEIACPVIAPLKRRASVTSYAAINRDSETRERSTSGGIFSAIAEHTISQGGVVYGAIYDPDWRVVHTRVESLEGLAQLRGSKYSQSDMRGVVRDIMLDLKGGCSVLFSGTPCQCDGVRRATSRWRDQITTVDMICHGVPSPKVFRHYLNEISNGGDIDSFAFRSKVGASWRDSATRYSVDGVEHSVPERVSDYFYIFLKDLALRPSCYRCPSKGGCSGSDITIADLWGLRRILPEMDDNRGCSLALVATQRGASLIQSISDTVELHEVDTKAALGKNPSYYRSAKEPSRRRERLFRSVDNGIKISAIVEVDRVDQKRLIERVKKVARILIDQLVAKLLP